MNFSPETMLSKAIPLSAPTCLGREEPLRIRFCGFHNLVAHEQFMRLLAERAVEQCGQNREPAEKAVDARIGRVKPSLLMRCAALRTVSPVMK